MNTLLPVLDRNAAIERMGDKEIYLEVAHFFAEHMLDTLQQVEQALAVSNTVDATRLAHSLKSNCATVGANSVGAICYELENQCRAKEIEKARITLAKLPAQFQALRQVLLAL